MLSQGLISKQQADWRAPEPAKEVKEAKKGKTTQFSLAEVETGLSGWHHQQAYDDTGEYIRRRL